MIFMNLAAASGSGQRADTIDRVPAPSTLRALYTCPPAWRTEWLAVADGHALHVQQFGSPRGVAALVLHGGPGSGCSPLLARFFDPQRYRVICVDQRGAGLSRPQGDVAHNTTAHLLADLRALREHLDVERWLVVGGSWGATLALAHAADVPEAVAGLLLRGVFLARGQDIAAFFDGPSHGRPQAWAALASRAEAEHMPLAAWLHRLLCSDDATVRAATALHWWRWEQHLSGIEAPAEPDAQAQGALVARYRIQSHYLLNRCWLGGLQERCARLPPVPTLLLHGTLDRICAPEGAAALHAHLPHSTLRWIDGAGHDPTHPRMIDAMVSALDAFATHGAFDAGLSR